MIRLQTVFVAFALLLVAAGTAWAQQDEAMAVSAVEFQDISYGFEQFFPEENDFGREWYAAELVNGSDNRRRILIISQPHLFGAGLLGFGQRIETAPIVMAGPTSEGAAGLSQVPLVRLPEGWSTELSFAPGERVGLAVGLLPTELAPTAALATDAGLGSQRETVGRLRGLLFGASLMLVALLFARGVLSGRSLYYAGLAMAVSLCALLLVLAGWHSGLFDPLGQTFVAVKAFILLLFVLTGLEFARQAMALKDLSPGPNRIALGLEGLTFGAAVACFFAPAMIGASVPLAIALTVIAGVVIVEGTRQDVDGPKLLLGPWLLFLLAGVLVAALGMLAPHRFGSEGVLLIQALLVAGTLAACLAIDRLVSAAPAAPAMAPAPAAPVRGSDHRYKDALSGARKGVWDWKIHGDRLYLSGEAMALLGFEAKGGEGSEEAFFARVHAEDQEGYRERLRSEVDRGSGHFVHDMRILSEEGHYRWLRLEASVSGGATLTGARIVGLLSDVTPEREKARTQGRDILKDPLTDLINRSLFVDRIEQALAHDGPAPAVILMDVDRFEAINDGVGHAGGDTMLIVLARRLEGVLEKHQVPARLGGDEFGVLVESDAHPDRVLNLAETILDVLSEPLQIEGQEIFPSLSIGIALGSAKDELDQPLIRRAEIAMYHAKRSGGARIETYRAEYAKRKGELMTLEAGLNRALERREVELLYQPIVNVEDGKLAGFEALMRWNHPEQGQMSPDRFLHLAEETGAIVPLGRYVIEAAATQLMAWQHAHQRKKALFVGVNLSARQILHHDLARDVEKIMSRITLARRSLIVEVTEAVVMENPELAERRLHSLGNEGLGLALDDFGTGYSALSHLARFNFGKLKIDREFVEAMVENSDTRKIVSAVINLAKDLRMDVVAEGVQTDAQLELLKSLDCDYAQGFKFGKPVTAAEAERLIIKDGETSKPAEAKDQARPESPES